MPPKGQLDRLLTKLGEKKAKHKEGRRIRRQKRLERENTERGLHLGPTETREAQEGLIGALKEMNKEWGNVRSNREYMSKKRNEAKVEDMTDSEPGEIRRNGEEKVTRKAEQNILEHSKIMASPTIDHEKIYVSSSKVAGPHDANDFCAVIHNMQDKHVPRMN